MNPAARSSRNFGLDLLRCFAIAGVVLAHGWPMIYPYVPKLPIGGGRALHLYHLGQLGFYGVELFFVLSGFLIGGILLGLGDRLASGRGLRGFYVRRWFRTLPNYYVFLAINILVFATWSQLPRYAIFLQNLWANHVSFFPESWSLGIEEWFYLLFPFALWILLRLRFDVDRAFLTAGAAFYVVSSTLRIVYALNPANNWGNILRIVTVLRFDALMTGIFAAWLIARRKRWFSAFPRCKALAGLGLLAYCYLTLYQHLPDNETFFARTFRFNLVSLGFALLLPLAVSWRDRRFPGVEAFARWSFSMYLINLPLSYLAEHALFPGYASSAAQGWAAFITLEVGTVSLAGLWYVIFERPTTRLRERFAHG